MADKKTKLNKDEVRNIQHQLAAIEIDVFQFTDAQTVSAAKMKHNLVGRLALIADALGIEQKSTFLLNPTEKKL